jgi:hypothetical protein
MPGFSDALVLQADSPAIAGELGSAPGTQP